MLLLMTLTLSYLRMTNLSPAARAILQAFDDRHELLGPFEGNWQEVCLAAALRAAAYQIQFEGQLGMTAYGGHAQAQRQLNTIANELEGDTKGR